MKTRNFAFTLLIVLAVLSSGCAVHFPLSTNMNQSITNVELSEKNFTVVKTVSAEASAQYILGFGGLKKRALVELAKKDLVAQAEMEGKSRALINLTVEEYVQNYVVLIRHKVVVTAQVVEFN